MPASGSIASAARSASTAFLTSTVRPSQAARFSKTLTPARMSSSTTQGSANPVLQSCLSANAEWSASVAASDPSFFPTLAKGQSPGVLWFGCSDSRVPESVVLNRKPGEVFVHRNIANQVQEGDDSAQAVLQFAVGALGVRQIVVVGHTSCGGCVAAHKAGKPDGAKGPDALSRFLGPLIELRHSLPADATLDDLIEANVRRGVETIARSDVVKNQWAEAAKAGGKEESVQVHGWVYDLATGKIRDLGCSAEIPAMQ